MWIHAAELCSATLTYLAYPLVYVNMNDEGYHDLYANGMPLTTQSEGELVV